MIADVIYHTGSGLTCIGTALRIYSIFRLAFTLTLSTMRPTLRALDCRVVRSKSTAFIGLGRMGSEMAYNLFSKKFAQSADSRFVVCDVVPDSAVTFRQNFLSQFPDASIDIVETPEE